AGTNRCSTGTTTAVAASRASRIWPPRSLRSQAGRREGTLAISALRRAAFLREQSPRPPLDEQDQRHQHQHLAEHGAREGFEQLVDHTRGQAAAQRAPQVAYAA